MKHADGTDYVLCPKVATGRMLHEMDGWTDLVDGSAGEGATAAEYKKGRLAEFGVAWEVAVDAAPPYEPSDEVVERVARAIAREWGFTDANTDWDMIEDAMRDIARAAIRAFIGGE